MLSQEIEAIIDVCNDRFFWGECEPPLSHELLYQGFDLLFQQFFRDARHDKIVGKSGTASLGGG